MSAEMCDTETAARLLDLLAEQRRTLEQMRDDLARLGGDIDALRREASVHDSATRRQLGQVASRVDRPVGK